MKSLFYRSYSKDFNSKYLNELDKKINSNNIKQLNWKKISELYQKKYEKEFLYFRFKILYDWISKQSERDSNFVDDLERNIKTLELKKFLTSNESNYIYFLKSYIFTSNRNIKTLIIDFPIEKDENVYFRYEQIKLYFDYKKTHKEINNIFDFFLSDKRFIFCGYLNIVSFKISDLNKIIFYDDSILFVLNKYSYKIISNDCKIIEISIKRLFKILKLGDLWD